jgi:hypothetical protein
MADQRYLHERERLADGYPQRDRRRTNQLFATFNVPNAVPGVSMYLPDPGPAGWFNPAAFSQPGQVLNAKGTPLTMFGNLGRGALGGVPAPRTWMRRSSAPSRCAST